MTVEGDRTELHAKRHGHIQVLRLHQGGVHQLCHKAGDGNHTLHVGRLLQTTACLHLFLDNRNVEEVVQVVYLRGIEVTVSGGHFLHVQHVVVVDTRAEALVGEGLSAAVCGRLSFEIVVLAYLDFRQLAVAVADIERGAAVGLRKVLVDGDAQGLWAIVCHLPLQDAGPGSALLQGGCPVAVTLHRHFNDRALHIGLNAACGDVFVDANHGRVFGIVVVLTGRDTEAEAAHQRGHQQ